MNFPSREEMTILMNFQGTECVSVIPILGRLLELLL
jgi:hypothetical protein